MIPLRDYQSIAMDRARLAYKSGARAVLLVSPTGSGKTVMLSQLVANHVAKGGTVNWYAHRRELTGQAADTLRAFGLDVEHAGMGRGARSRVLSVQSVLSSGEVPECSMAVFDEAHHFAAAAEEWVKLVHAHKNAMIVGATATPERGDGSPLSPPFDRMIVVAQVSDLVARGYLTPCEIYGPRRYLNSMQIAQRPVDMYKRFAKGQRNVVFAPLVRIADDYAREFAAEGIEAVVVHGATPKDERDRALARFAAGDLRVIVNVYVLTEGWDCPATSCVTVARGVGSAGMWLQMVGRGMRPAPGKTRCTLLDCVGAVNKWGRPEDPREFSLVGKGISLLGAAGETLDRRCRMCGGAFLEESLTCSECGYEEQVKALEVTGDEVVKWAHLREQDNEQKKIERLGRWLRDAKARGYKKGWALGKFKAVYGNFPPRNWVQIAEMGEAS